MKSTHHIFYKQFTSHQASSSSHIVSLMIVTKMILNSHPSSTYLLGYNVSESPKQKLLPISESNRTRFQS